MINRKRERDSDDDSDERMIQDDDQIEVEAPSQNKRQDQFGLFASHSNKLNLQEGLSEPTWSTLFGNLTESTVDDYIWMLITDPRWFRQVKNMFNKIILEVAFHSIKVNKNAHQDDNEMMLDVSSQEHFNYLANTNILIKYFGKEIYNYIQQNISDNKIPELKEMFVVKNLDNHNMYALRGVLFNDQIAWTDMQNVDLGLELNGGVNLNKMEILRISDELMDLAIQLQQKPSNSNEQNNGFRI